MLQTLLQHHNVVIGIQMMQQHIRYMNGTEQYSRLMHFELKNWNRMTCYMIPTSFQNPTLTLVTRS